ncbi:MAG: endo-1,4-beta-xylanase [Asticcacaulis sp.]|nr:endo-1,4-beta-xylanase [Asticcacaulis sp.]
MEHTSLKTVTLWGVADSHTWLDEYPARRPNHPLLFDAHGAP